MGLANSVEISAGFGFEGARLTLEEDGTILLTTGATNQGQGHRTALAQIAADTLMVPIDQVRVIEGDTNYIKRSIGTFGSRTIIMAGNAIRVAGKGFIDLARERAAQVLEAHVEDLQFDDGRFFVKGVPSVTLDWRDLADAIHHSANPVMPQYEDYFDSNHSTFGFGAHAAVVRIDEKTRNVRIERYVILHDSGKVVNPLLADGQVIGGAVQGLGTALYEEMLFSEDGQPLTTSFLDYRLPGAAEMPDFELHHRNYPAPTNPDGYKGVGEAGIIPSQAIMLSAVEDAYRDVGLRLDHSPITPGRLFQELSKSEVSS
jgi:carbon-monoxide dehydrogenase large subunit